MAAVPVLLGVSVLTFVSLSVLPGNAAQQLLGPEATPEQIAELTAALDLDLPAWRRYLEWITGVITGDFGHSLTSGQPVTALIAQALPVSLELSGYAILLAVIMSVSLALVAALKPRGLGDRLGGVIGMCALSVPNYVLAIVLVLVFSVNLGVFPSIGFTPLSESVFANIRSVTLPAIAIACPLFGFYTRFLRDDLLEQMRNAGYVLTARSMGLRRWRVIVRHALRNSLFGFITIVGLNFGTLIGGTVVIEQIFGIPGIGKLLVQAVNVRDVVTVQMIVLGLAVITMIANVSAEVLCSVLDPRIRHGRP